jgi:ketopantoate reductase
LISGRELIDWLVVHTKATARENAIDWAQRLLNAGLIFPVAGAHNTFQDSGHLYQFKV